MEGLCQPPNMLGRPTDKMRGRPCPLPSIPVRAALQVNPWRPATIPPRAGIEPLSQLSAAHTDLTPTGPYR